MLADGFQTFSGDFFQQLSEQKSTQMTEQQHPITSPPELVKRWCEEASHILGHRDVGFAHDHFITSKAAQWGADLELNACCAEVKLNWHRPGLAEGLRTARRPKQTVSAEEALKLLDEMDKPSGVVTNSRCSAIREALERLKELESDTSQLARQLQQQENN